MKGTYNVNLLSRTKADKPLLQRRNWYLVQNYLNNLPLATQVALEEGSRIEIQRADLPQQEI